MKTDILFPNHKDLKLPFVIQAVGAGVGQPRRKRDEGAVNTQIIYGNTGEGRLEFGGRTHLIRPGDCFLLPKGVPHDYYPTTDDWATSWLCFDGECVSATLDALGLARGCVAHLPDPTRADTMFKSVFTELRGDPVCGQLRASTYVYRMIMEVHLARSTCAQNESTEKLRPVLEYIDAHIDQVIALEELSSLMGLSPQHFCRVFKECLNERPFQYILKRRIQVSKRYLMRSPLRIADVGRMVGMDNSSYFCYNFKKLEGITPTEFRAMYAD